MPTGSKHVDIYNKQSVPREGWDTYFFRYLDGKVDESTRSAFLSAGVLSESIIGLTSTANDTFEVDITNATRGVDDSGNIMDLSLAESEEIEDIAFENAIGITYYTGFRFQEVPNGIERNPRSSEPEYPWNLDTIGELGDPDSVTDNATYIRLELDGILEASVDHSGRLVRVWLDNPVSPVDSVAYFDGIVSYGSTNYVDIPYTGTAGPLGQTAPTFPISTTASDYTVLIRGLSWFRNTDISADSNYVFLGTVQGSGTGTTPTVFDTNGQIATFLISLQRAYYGNSTDDPAPGRSIWAHRGAVKIRQSASSVYEQDYANAALWIDKQDEDVTLSVGTLSLFAESLTTFSIPGMELRSLNDGVGNNLQSLEAATISGGTLTLTRGGVDLTAFPDFHKVLLVVLLEGTTNGLHDGMYFSLGTPGVNTMSMLDFDVSVTTFPADSCNARVFFPISMNIYTSPLETSYGDSGKYLRTIPPANDGIHFQMLGRPRGDNKFHFVGAVDGNKSNNFYNLVAGRIWMTGGGSEVAHAVMEGTVRGTAAYQSDKRETGELGPNWIPDEAAGEWGFDYRGSEFGKDTTTDEPGYQIAASFRQPLTFYDGGGQALLSEEAFTSLNSTQLDFTRGGFDNAAVPAYSGGTGGRAWVMAEVQFDTPHASDGVYFVQSQSGGTTLSFQSMDGTAPSFPTTQTGVCRFYGGSFFGTYNAAYGGNTGWVQTIIPPTRKSGGLRLIFDGEDLITSTEYRWGALIHGYGATLQMWGVRDGGVMFSRAITTRAWEGGHELTQWDMVDTALVNTDLVVSDLYNGTLAQIGEIDLVEGTYDLTLPSTVTDCNIFKQDGGGTWTEDRLINIFKLATGTTGGAPHWDSPLSASYIVSNFGNTEVKIPIYIPQGATLNTVSLYCDPFTGNGTSASMGITIYRKSFVSTTPIILQSTGILYASSGAVQTFTVTLDQNNVIDNTIYIYWIEVKASDSPGDVVYTARVNYSIDKFGEHFFDCF